MNNVEHYNQLLRQLSYKHNFLYFDLHIPNHWLGDDLMHIGHRHRHEFSGLLLNCINALHVNRNPLKDVDKHSREATQRRNKKRNLKSRNIRKSYALVREISPVSSYTHVKNFLKLHHVQYASISITPTNTLYLQFNNSLHLMNANEILPSVIHCQNFARYSEEHH